MITSLTWQKNVSVLSSYDVTSYGSYLNATASADKFCRSIGLDLPTILELLSITDMFNKSNTLSDVFVPPGTAGIHLARYVYPGGGVEFDSIDQTNQLIRSSFGLQQVKYRCISNATRLRYPLFNITNETVCKHNLLYRRLVETSMANRSFCTKFGDGWRLAEFIELIAIYMDLDYGFGGSYARSYVINTGSSFNNRHTLPQEYKFAVSSGMWDSRTNPIILTYPMYHACVLYMPPLDPPKIKTQSQKISATKSKAILSHSSTLRSSSKSKAQSLTLSNALTRTISTKQSKTESRHKSQSLTTALIATQPTTQQSTSSTTIEQAKPTSILSTTHQTSLIISTAMMQENTTIIPQTTLKQRTRTSIPPQILVPVVRLSPQEQATASSVNTVAALSGPAVVLTSRMNSMLQPTCSNGNSEDSDEDSISRFQSPLLLQIQEDKKLGLLVGNFAIIAVFSIVHYLITFMPQLPRFFISPSPTIMLFMFFLEPNLSSAIAMLQRSQLIAIPFLMIIVICPFLLFFVISRRFRGQWIPSEEKPSFFKESGRWRGYEIWDCLYGDYRGEPWAKSVESEGKFIYVTSKK